MKIRNELLSQVRSYAGHTPHAAEDTLDCSLGVNPYGFPPVVKEAFAAFDPDRFYHYPHSDAPQKAIVDYWADYAFIEPENIVLTDGSVSALYLLCNILAKKGAEVVGFLPTFTDMVEYSRMMAMRYVGIPARREENWRMEVSDLVDAISGDTSLVYIDRPNNPTGQTLSLADISRVLDRCEELGVYAIVDEAYGDFLPREESAVTLGPKYKNIIIVRTFSKGFGLAGLRAGYIITGQELIRYISKVSNPYMMSELSRELAAAALSDRTYADSHGPDFAAMKRSLRGVCGKELTMAETDDRVPICLLQHRNPRADLQELLDGEFESLSLAFAQNVNDGYLEFVDLMDERGIEIYELSPELLSKVEELIQTEVHDVWVADCEADGVATAPISDAIEKYLAEGYEIYGAEYDWYK